VLLVAVTVATPLAVLFLPLSLATTSRSTTWGNGTSGWSTTSG
jgi:hypothetical protein